MEMRIENQIDWWEKICIYKQIDTNNGRWYLILKRWSWPNKAEDDEELEVNDWFISDILSERERERRWFESSSETLKPQPLREINGALVETLTLTPVQVDKLGPFVIRKFVCTFFLSLKYTLFLNYIKSRFNQLC